MELFNGVLNFLKEIFHWWVVVQPWQQGFRVRLGKHTMLMEPGIHLRVPIIDQMYVQPIRLRVISIKDQCLMTSDKKIVALAGSLGYKINDVLKLYKTLHQPAETVEQLVMGVISKAVFEMNLNDISTMMLTEKLALKLI